MRFKQYLQEEYMGMFQGFEHSNKYKGGETEVFKNPSKQEIRDIVNSSKIRSVRFYINLTNKTIYIWKADTVHYSVAQDFLDKMMHEPIDYRNSIKGVAAVSNGKLTFASDRTKADYFDYPDGSIASDNYNFDWLKQWFTDDDVNYFKTKLLRIGTVIVNPTPEQIKQVPYKDIVAIVDYGNQKLYITSPDLGFDNIIIKYGLNRYEDNFIEVWCTATKTGKLKAGRVFLPGFENPALFIRKNEKNDEWTKKWFNNGFIPTYKKKEGYS
jgi:hypothetical protein